MDCKYSCFDRVMHLVKPLDEEDKWVMCELITDYSFSDILDYGIEKGCFTKSQAQTLYEGIVMWEDLDGNYYEEDEDKLVSLYDAMGITTEHVLKYQRQTEIDVDRKYFLELFYKRWNDTKDTLKLEDEDGNHHLLDKNIFHKFFISPEILVGFYVWRDFSYEEFLDEYDGWVDDCKDIATKAKKIFERIIK